MGIISRSPNAQPPQPYVPPPVVTIPVAPEPQEPVKTDEEMAAETRQENLLRRSRGTLGTILTGFRGFLNPSDEATSGGRKTLLGE